MWFKSKHHAAPVSSRGPATVPEGVRIYAIGDIHGCAQLLDGLVARIAQDIAQRPVSTPLAVFLGDYIDRGPASAQVLMRFARHDFPFPVVTLRGNHEAMLDTFLNDASYLASWRRFGGLETLHSFGLDVSRLLTEADFERARDQLESVLPPEIRTFLAATQTHYTAGDYYFCHAGVRPGIPLASQKEEDLLWIREEFLTSTADHGKLIVHGHTPVETPEMRPNRINIDTGAYLSGTLTSIILEASDHRFMTT